MTKIKEDALKEPHKVSEGGRNIRSNYLFCPMFCRSCIYFEESESNWPYTCSQGTTDNIANRSKREDYRQYDECKYYKEKGDTTESYNPLKSLFTGKESSNSTIDNIVDARRKERENEEQEFERRQDERRRQKEEQEREREEARRREAEEEYNKTHCFSCGEKGMLVEFLEKYFHEKCLEIFKNSKNGKEWIDEQEQNKKQKEMFLERCKQIRAIVKKYDNVFSDPIEEFNNFAYFTTTTNYDKQIDAFLNADMKKFTSYVEDFYNSELKKKKKAEEEYNKRQEEQKQQERQKKEAEEQAKIETENKAKELQTKKRLYRKTQLPFFIVGTIITLFFNDTLLLVVNQWGDGKFIPIIALAVVLVMYSGLLKALMSSGYETIKEELQKGNKTGRFGTFIVYAGLGLVATAIHSGIVFLVMHLLLKLW